MKYIIQSIIKSIAAQNPSKDKQLRFRLSGFEDIQIYAEICRFVATEYNQLDVVAKLATEKYEYFKTNGSNPAALEYMKNQNWIAGEKSLTYYRNLPQKKAQLIILMGTEAVDDQGGLSDLYYIDPSRIVSELHGNYHLLFGFEN